MKNWCNDVNVIKWGKEFQLQETEQQIIGQNQNDCWAVNFNKVH